ncbi:MAG: rod shape-determining protein MreD [Spirochaetes bacterium]|nr:rod shape-determining protein MreD [Spirochaetota bacterium]
MNRIIINAIIIIIIAVLSSSKYVVDFVAIKGGLPDLALIFTVYTGLFQSAYSGMIFGFIVGLALDIMLFYPLLGLNTFVYTMIGYLCFLPNKMFEVENTLLSSLVILIYFFIRTVLYFVLSILVGEDFTKPVLIELIYTILLSFPIFLFYIKIYKSTISRKKNV